MPAKKPAEPTVETEAAPAEQIPDLRDELAQVKATVAELVTERDELSGKLAEALVTVATAEASAERVAELEKQLADATPEPVEERREWIEKVNHAGAWWCPFDDHSNASQSTRCAGCGAVRDGDEAVKT